MGYCHVVIPEHITASNWLHCTRQWTQATKPLISMPIGRLQSLTTEEPRTRQLNSLHFNAYFLCMPRGWLLFDNPIQLVIKPKAVRYYMPISTINLLSLLLTLLTKKEKLTLPQILNDQTSKAHCYLIQKKKHTAAHTHTHQHYAES